MDIAYKPDWSRVSNNREYKLVFCPDHPNAWKSGYVFIHRIVAEHKLGRLLKKGEVVHHLNGNTADNSPENIEVRTVSGHNSLHASTQKKKIVVLRCPWCLKVFERRRGQTFLTKGGDHTACSRSCSRRIQAKRGNPGIETAIKNCVIAEKGL